MIEILYSKSHEFVFNKENFCYIGLSDVILSKLTEINLIKTPQIGEYYAKGEIFGYIEALNAAKELFMPVSGKIETVNSFIVNNPKIINTLKTEDGWIIKISSEFYNEDKKDLILYNEYKKETE